MGLGNPGRDYAHNRHNVGFWCVNRLARSYSIELTAARRVATLVRGTSREGTLSWRSRGRSSTTAATRRRPSCERFRILPERLLVICDSLDLPVGAVRVRARGAATAATTA